MDLQILNTGDTPTFETHRGDKLCTSIVDVTACSASLLGRIQNWKVDRNITTSDHNAITFTLRVDKEPTSVRPSTTRRYNTKKAKWSDFQSHVKNSLATHNITPDTIKNTKTPEDLESTITLYTTIIQEACNNSIPSIRSREGNPNPPWWSKELEEKKKEVLRKKRRIRNAAPGRRQAVVIEYLTAKEDYTNMANDAQTESWKEFCTTQDKESMWDGIYRVIRKTARRHEDPLLRDELGNTLGPEKSAELLANTFYPNDTTTTDTPYHMHLRKVTVRDQTLRELSEDDPPFTPAELDIVLKALNPKKAPGPDGFTSDICAKAINCDRKVFMAIANKCFSLPHFPKQWKMAHVIILRKPGKDDYTQPKSYRPIGLLSILGKIIEKMMVGRLQWHILPTLNQTQYGFMPQRGTEDALYDLMKHIRSELAEKKIVVIISLDIEGAFDNAWWPALKNQLISRKCPKNLFAMVDSYLQNRRVLVNYAKAEHARITTKGCVQGSIGGPTFWNLILDSLLHKLTDKGIHCQAFADDVVLVFSGHKMSAMEFTMNDTLDGIVNWGESNKLNFAAHKTNAMIITKKLKYDTPNIFMSKKRLQVVDEIKLLGLIIDNKLTFKPHVTALCKKTADIYKQLACAAKVTWGLNREITRTIYVAVIEPIVLYAASVWHPAVELQLVRNQLDALQRGFAQKICKAYRTVSLTSALVLSGLLPLDLRIQEAASLYKAKKSISVDYLPPEKNIESNTHYLDQPHPSSLTSTKYCILENLDQDSLDSHQITGPHIYTDGSKMDGKVGAALTWWEDGRETNTELYKLDSACTVFQAELYALYRAIVIAKRSGVPVVNIMSDSRSSLELLENPKTKHPLATQIQEILKGRTQIRLFWVRAHVGTPGNERADELAKTAAQLEIAPHYSAVPLSYIKRKIREESVLKWQDRYITSKTGRVTKIFFPNVGLAYKTVREIKITPLMCQAFTGHGGLAEYLHRFKLKDSPGCECDSNISETVEHIILECPRFAAARLDTEININTTLNTSTLNTILSDKLKRPHLLKLIETIIKTTNKRNSTIVTGPRTDSNDPNPSKEPPPIQPSSRFTLNELLRNGEGGEIGIRIRGVALFMDTNTERLGICYCMVGAGTGSRVMLSPGLSVILNGSTNRNTMKRKTFDALPETTIAEQQCRLVRVRNKTIALFQWDLLKTPFTQASAMLQELAKHNTSPRRISVDAMAVGYEKSAVDDYLGCIEASKRHEIVVYENRGEDLSFLKPLSSSITTAPAQTSSHTDTVEPLSGSEKLQQKRVQETETIKSKTISTLTTAVNTFHSALHHLTGGKEKVSNILTTEKVGSALRSFLTNKPKPPTTSPQKRTKADMGQVEPPHLREVKGPLDHVINAVLEFLALSEAEQKVSRMTCENIMQSYRLENTGLLEVRIEEAEAAIYNNDTSETLLGKETGSHMVAFSETGGFVELDEEESKKRNKAFFKTPPTDPIVVIARCTRVMLNEKIIQTAQKITGPHNELMERWEAPKFKWVNGVPGCGKTTWIIRNFVPKEDVVITTTTEGAKDLREKLAPTIGTETKIRVRTMASVLVNGFKEGICKRIIVDEALMNHFGAIVLATKLAGAKETLLIGDKNQLPFIERNNVFTLHYCRPNSVVSIDKELLCTHRNPMDVAYAMSEVYNGIYSSKSQIKSLQLKEYSNAKIPKTQEDTLYLTHTQGEKDQLKEDGYGIGTGSRVNTIHEAQGATFENVVIVRTSQRKIELHDSVPHAVVAISRHTGKCVYYTDDKSDAIAYFISKAEKATSSQIREHIIKMAIRNGDEKVARALIT